MSTAYILYLCALLNELTDIFHLTQLYVYVFIISIWKVRKYRYLGLFVYVVSKKRERERPNTGGLDSFDFSSEKDLEQRKKKEIHVIWCFYQDSFQLGLCLISKAVELRFMR